MTVLNDPDREKMFNWAKNISKDLGFPSQNSYDLSEIDLFTEKERVEKLKEELDEYIKEFENLLTIQPNPETE